MSLYKALRKAANPEPATVLTEVHSLGMRLTAGLVGGEDFAVDASLIEADANRQRSIAGRDWHRERDLQHASRAVKEYLATLNDAAFGAATEVAPKFVSPAFFAYADNYLIDMRSDVDGMGRHSMTGSAKA
jgi:hypothetical protein